MEKLSLLQQLNSQQEETKMPRNIWEIFDANPGGGPANAAGQPKIGHKAVSAALAAGHSISDIQGALGSDLGRARTSSQNQDASVAGSLASDLASTGPTSRWGVSDTSEGQSAYVGQADVNFMRQQNLDSSDILNHMEGRINPEGSLAYQDMVTGIRRDVDLTNAQNAISDMGGKYDTLNSAYGNLSGQYGALSGKYDALTSDYGTLQADVAQAAKDALKIKYTGSTAVRNPSAMGIQAAQGTPFRGSGLAGTAALARPNKGLKIKTLNV